MNRFIAMAVAVPLFVVGMAASMDTPPRVVTISAKRFEFTPNQITLKRGEPVTLRVSAEDRDHGSW